MDVPTYFSDFLNKVRPTDSQVEDIKSAHEEVSNLLREDEILSQLLVTTFIQGSYRRATLVQPLGAKKPDIDLVAVTNIDKEVELPQQAVNRFIPFLERKYANRYREQGRSIGIDFESVNLDLVITSAPSEIDLSILQKSVVTSLETPDDVGDWKLVETWVPLAERMQPQTKAKMDLAAKEEEWKTEPLWIPDREKSLWQPTNPLEVMKWTWEKNRKTNGHYVNIVKAIKWWRQISDPNEEKPKGYLLEHILGYVLPDDIESVGSGILTAFEGILSTFQESIAINEVPWLPAYGVPDQNVLARVKPEEFERFCDDVRKAAIQARKALEAQSVEESAYGWRELLGEKFPLPPSGDTSKGGKTDGGYTEREKETLIGGGRFAVSP